MSNEESVRRVYIKGEVGTISLKQTLSSIHLMDKIESQIFFTYTPMPG